MHVRSLHRAREHYKYTEPGKWSLFDLSNDPHEDCNLADVKPDVVEKMSKSFDDWWADLTFPDKPNITTPPPVKQPKRRKTSESRR